MKIDFDNPAEGIRFESWINQEVTDECEKGHSIHCPYEILSIAILDGINRALEVERLKSQHKTKI